MERNNGGILQGIIEADETFVGATTKRGNKRDDDEGFWSLLKRAWYGQHHKYKVKFLPLYVAEACWKYNNTKQPEIFDFFVRKCLVSEFCRLRYWFGLCRALRLPA